MVGTLFTMHFLAVTGNLVNLLSTAVTARHSTSNGYKCKQCNLQQPKIRFAKFTKLHLFVTLTQIFAAILLGLEFSVNLELKSCSRLLMSLNYDCRYDKGLLYIPERKLRRADSTIIH